MSLSKKGELRLTAADHVALVEIVRPPNNFFDFDLVAELADMFTDLDETGQVRAIVLASEGKAFCAGADFTGQEGTTAAAARDLYKEGLRLFACGLPVIAAIQGPAIGGGLGLALAADFRVACPESRFSGNFVKIGIHPGFALTHTLPRLVGVQQAARLLYTGRRIAGEEALAIGLVDELVPAEELRSAALRLAGEIAENAPLAVRATKATLRGDLVERVRIQQALEKEQQLRLMQTEDFKEGVRAVRERQPGRWLGR